VKNQKTPKNTCSPNVKNPGKLRNIENFQGFEHSKFTPRAGMTKDASDPEGIEQGGVRSA